ncbi:hypothetical protein [Staphylothermus marinus]|nr:hypothetical protein [Staphylothermus marinus]
MDYGTQASNRADMFYIDRVLIQWYLGFFELKLPLPKNTPYIIRVGNGMYRSGELIWEEGFDSFTPILVFNKCYLISRPRTAELLLERMTPYCSIIAPKPSIEWDKIALFKGEYSIDVPGVYRVRAVKKGFVEVYAICKP